MGRTHEATDVTTPHLVNGVDPDTGLDQDDIIFGGRGDDGMLATQARQIGVMMLRTDDNPTPDAVEPFTMKQRAITRDVFEDANGQPFENGFCWEVYGANCSAADLSAEIDAQSVRLYLEKLAVNEFTNELFGIGSDTYLTHVNSYFGVAPDNPNGLPGDEFGMGFSYDDSIIYPETSRGKYKQMADVDTRLPGFNACVGNGTGESGYLGTDIKWFKNDFKEALVARFGYLASFDHNVVNANMFDGMLVLERSNGLERCVWGYDISTDNYTFVPVSGASSPSKIASAPVLAAKSDVGPQHNWLARLSVLTIDAAVPTNNEVTLYDKQDLPSGGSNYGSMQFSEYQSKIFDTATRLPIREFYADGSVKNLNPAILTTCNAIGTTCNMVSAGDQWLVGE
jgi:hypothetical protein